MSDNRGMAGNANPMIQRAAAVEPLEGRLCFSVFAASHALSPLGATRFESFRPRAMTVEQHEHSFVTRANAAATATASNSTNCDPSQPAAATTATTAAPTPVVFAEKIVIALGNAPLESMTHLGFRSEQRVERFLAERAERFEHQLAARAQRGTPTGESSQSDGDGLGETVGSSVVPVTLVQAPQPAVEIIIIQQVGQLPQVQLPPQASNPAPQGAKPAHNVAPAAADSAVTAAAATTIVRPAVSVAGALQAVATVGGNVAQTIEAVAATTAGAVSARFATSAPVMTASGNWGRVASIDPGVTRYVQEFSAVAGVARVAAAVEQVLGLALPGGSSDIAPTADVSAAPQRTFEFAHMGWPLSLLADSMANFAEDSAATAAGTVMPSAATRGLASASPWNTAWAVTATVIAADVVVLTCINRRGARRRRQQQESFAVHPMIA